MGDTASKLSADVSSALQNPLDLEATLDLSNAEWEYINQRALDVSSEALMIAGCNPERISYEIAQCHGEATAYTAVVHRLVASYPRSKYTMAIVQFLLSEADKAVDSCRELIEEMEKSGDASGCLGCRPIERRNELLSAQMDDIQSLPTAASTRATGVHLYAIYTIGLKAAARSTCHLVLSIAR